MRVLFTETGTVVEINDSRVRQLGSEVSIYKEKGNSDIYQAVIDTGHEVHDVARDSYDVAVGKYLRTDWRS